MNTETIRGYKTNVLKYSKKIFCRPGTSLKHLQCGGLVFKDQRGKTTRPIIYSIM